MLINEMKLVSYIILFISAFFISLAACKEKGALPTAKITVGGKALTVEVADNNQARQKGLMHRTEMPADHGMLFVFNEKRPLSFWTKNTFIPLSIGFFDENFRLVNVEKMQPLKSVMDKNITYYQSKGPALLALEVNQGWFEKNKIKVGSKLHVLKPNPSKLLQDLTQKFSGQ